MYWGIGFWPLLPLLWIILETGSTVNLKNTHRKCWNMMYTPSARFYPTKVELGFLRKNDVPQNIPH